MYFKSEYHEEVSRELLKEFGQSDFETDRRLGVFCYLAGATYKLETLKQAFGPDGMEDTGMRVHWLWEQIKVYSSSERALIRFAMQLYNQLYEGIIMPNVMYNLDSKNEKVVMQALAFLYRIPIKIEE